MASSPQPHPLQLVRGDFADLDDVMAVMNAAFDPHYGEAWSRSQCAGILPMNGVTLTLAREGDALVGFSLFRVISDEAELLLLAVAPDRQGQHVGRTLLEQFVSQASAEGAARLHLEVRDGNPATHLYENAGFHLAGRRRRYYHGTEGEMLDALTYVKIIA